MSVTYQNYIYDEFKNRQRREIIDFRIVHLTVFCLKS